MTAEEFTKELSVVEGKLDRLKALYEQYFQGLERLEPSIPRRDIERRIDQLRRNIPRNTALRFRFQQMTQRYTTFTVYWGRTIRQIEEGTFKRDLIKVQKRRQAERERRENRRQGFEELYMGDLEEVKDDEIDQIERELERELAGEFNKRHSTMPSPPSGDLKTPTPPPQVVRVSLVPSGGVRGKEPTRPGGALPLPKQAVPPAPGTRPGGALPLPKQAVPPAPGTRPGGALPLPKQAVPPAPGTRPGGALPLPKQAVPPAPGTRPGGALPLPKQAVVSQAAPVPPKVAEPRRADLSEPEMRQLYQRYVKTRHQTQESSELPSYESLNKRVKQWLPELQQKNPGKRIDFEVVVVKGRVGLKPILKDDK